MAALQRDFLGERKVIPAGLLPVDQVNVFMRSSWLDLHADRIAEQLVRPQVRLIERDAGDVGGRLELLQCGGDVRIGVAAILQVRAQQLAFDRAVVLAFAPVAEIVVAQIVGSRLVGEQRHDAVLRRAFGAGPVTQRRDFGSS